MLRHGSGDSSGWEGGCAAKVWCAKNVELACRCALHLFAPVSTNNNLDQWHSNRKASPAITSCVWHIKDAGGSAVCGFMLQILYQAIITYSTLV